MNKFKVYDNGGKTIDRYTIVIENAPLVDIYTMADKPEVFNQYSHSAKEYKPSSDESEINFRDLPLMVKLEIKDRARTTDFLKNGCPRN